MRQFDLSSNWAVGTIHTNPKGWKSRFSFLDKPIGKIENAYGTNNTLRLAQSFQQGQCKRRQRNTSFPYHWLGVRHGLPRKISRQFQYWEFMAAVCVVRIGAHRPHVASCMTGRPNMHERGCDTQISCTLRAYINGADFQPWTIICDKGVCRAFFWGKWDAF